MKCLFSVFATLILLHSLNSPLLVPFLYCFLYRTDERKRAVLCMNQESILHSLSPAPTCTNTGQYKMLKRKKSNKYDHISLPVIRVLTDLSIGCGSGEWMEKTRLTEDVGAGSFCCRWFELAIAVDQSFKVGKGGKWHTRFSSTGSLINRHVLVLKTSSKHPLPLLHEGPYYVKII